MKGQRTEVPGELGLINSTAQRAAALELTPGDAFSLGPSSLQFSVPVFC